MRFTPSLGAVTISVKNRYVPNNAGPGVVSTSTVCPVPRGHTSVLVWLYMKGHAALENLNGGINNQTPASIALGVHSSPSLHLGVVIRQVTLIKAYLYVCMYRYIYYVVFF